VVPAGGKKVAFALGGGAARGIAHLGVLGVLLDEGIRPDLIVGTSIGALAGGLYAVRPDRDTVIKRVRDYFDGECFKKTKFDFLKVDDTVPDGDSIFDAFGKYLKKSLFYNVCLTRRSFVSPGVYLENIAHLIDDILLQETTIPLATVCTDVYSGERVILTEGSLRAAVAASAAIPGVFPPVDIEGRLLVDGGWIEQLPTRAARDLGADLVIAVDVAADLEPGFSPVSGLDILRRANAITRNRLNRILRAEADLVITPDVGNVSWAGFECVDNCLLRGEEAARRALPAIRKLYDVHSALSRRDFSELISA